MFSSVFIVPSRGKDSEQFTKGIVNSIKQLVPSMKFERRISPISEKVNTNHSSFEAVFRKTL